MKPAITRATNEAIRIFVVEDDFPYRMYLRELLDRQHDMNVVGEASNGEVAVQRIAETAPDIVIMDMKMPGMDGIEAARKIAKVPIRVIMLSAHHDRDTLRETLKTGVATAMHKDRDRSSAWSDAFLATVRRQAGGQTTPVTGSSNRANGTGTDIGADTARTAIRAVCVGASTGGADALAKLLCHLPDNLSAPVLVALHIGDKLDRSVADWLSRESGRKVHLAREGETLASLSGRVVMGRAGHDLTVRNGRLKLSPVNAYDVLSPGVDALFLSVAEEWGPDAVGVVLTGMGTDGAHGLLAMREAGALTLAQDEESSAVYGMPEEAARSGGAKSVLSLAGIASAINMEAERLRNV